MDALSLVFSDGPYTTSPSFRVAKSNWALHEPVSIDSLPVSWKLLEPYGAVPTLPSLQPRAADVENQRFSD